MDIFVLIIALTVILFTIVTWSFMSKVLFSALFEPKLLKTDVLNFIDNKKCSVVAHMRLSNSEKKLVKAKNSTKNRLLEYFFIVRSNHKILAYSKSENKYRLFLVDIFQYSIPLYFGKRHLNIKEEKDPEILERFTKPITKEFILIDNECPACNFELSKGDSKCKNCDLNFI